MPPEFIGPRLTPTTHLKYQTHDNMVPTVDGVFRCTFKDCDLSFDTERSMRRHKKFSEKHDYCGLCDQDFESYDDLAQHKIFRPDKHHLACRICGEEFKSKDGLKLHVETVS